MKSSPRGPGYAALRCREIPYREDGPIAIVGELPPGSGRWLLDSAHPDARLGRYAFAGSAPCVSVDAWVEGAGGRAEVACRRAPFASPLLEPGRSGRVGDPLTLLRELCPVVAAPRLDWPSALPPTLPFVGGAVTGLGYRLGAAAESVDLRREAGAAGQPDLRLRLVDRLLAWDHAEARAWAIASGYGDAADAARDAAEAGLADWLRELEGPLCRAQAHTPRSDAASALRREAARRALLATPLRDEPDTTADRTAYLAGIATAQQEIVAGNVYEVNLTRRLGRTFRGDPWALYLALRQRNPAPFACFIEFEDAVVVGSSPERFLRVDPDGAVESRPIKGTRPRGATAAADAELEKALVTSEKDRAENLMIVDLVRNDLGRVCEIGSVAVPELMRVEAYSSVFQLVSSVVGRLGGDHDRVDLIRAAFPPGSMTGAPKRAAMQLIDRLEARERGLYSGAIGYLDLRGGMDLSVVIRTLLVANGAARFDVGGAIVADSDPFAEYEETLDKARGLLAALGDLEAERG